MLSNLSCIHRLAGMHQRKTSIQGRKLHQKSSTYVWTLIWHNNTVFIVFFNIFLHYSPTRDITTGHVAAFSPSVEKCFTVTFHVLVPIKEWEWNDQSEIHLLFGHKDLGDWKILVGDFGRPKRCSWVFEASGSGLHTRVSISLLISMYITGFYPGMLSIAWW